jgi:hypothetical protein
MEKTMLSVLFTEKMKEGKKLAGQLLAMHGQAVELQQQLGPRTESEVTQEEPDSIKVLRSLLEDSQQPDSVEGWAEKIGSFFKTLNSAMENLSKEITGVVSLKESKKSNMEQFTVKEVLKAMAQVHLHISKGHIIKVSEDHQVVLEKDFDMAMSDLMLLSFSSWRKVDERGESIIKVAKGLLEIYQDGVRINPEGEKAIADQSRQAVHDEFDKEMDNKVLTIANIQKEGSNVKFYAKNSSDLPTTRRIALWFHNHVGKNFFTWLSVGLVFFSVFLVFANGKKDEIINNYEVQLQNAADKTLEFDYLQSYGYASPRTFLFLDSVFVTHRNQAEIWLRCRSPWLDTTKS